MNAVARKLLRDAAQLIEDNAESLRDCCTVGSRWDSAGDRRIYEREKRIADRLRDLEKAA